MFEPILICEFGEEMQDLDGLLKELAARSRIPMEELVQAVCGSAPSGMSISEVDAAMREFSRCAAPVLRECKPRRLHPKHRPPRTREGYPWLWVVPHSAYRSTPERGIKWRRMFRPFLHFPQTGSG